MRIRWTEPALRDFTDVCDYTRIHLGHLRARQTALQIYEAVSRIQKFPFIGRPGRKQTTRELAIERLPFIIIYRVHELEHAIEVLRVLHGAQKWP